MRELYKILLVDDEEEVRKSIIKKINWEEEGFLVVGDAENGVEALEKIENLNPDLVFTDIRMPYMDGLELINEINIRYPLIKSIIFSGFDDFDYAKEAIKMGVIEYVLKSNKIEDKDDAVMIGDKSHDIVGAKNLGLKSIGVLYGYGGLDEFTDANYIVKSVEDLREMFIC